MVASHRLIYSQAQRERYHAHHGPLSHEHGTGTPGAGYQSANHTCGTCKLAGGVPAQAGI
eukprot:5611478-Prorocentrum_lima.AAC.1